MKSNPSQSNEILFGIHSVREALRAGRRKIQALYLTRETPRERLTEIVDLAEGAQIPIRIVKPERLRKMSGGEPHQGVCAEAGRFPLTSEDDLLAGLDEKAFLLILDQVVDPRNFGALTRTALSAGVNAVIIPRDRSVSPTPTVCRASAGALEHMDIVSVTNLVRTMTELKSAGLWIAGMDRTADTSLYASRFKGPLAIVIGSEQKGLRPLVRKNCDFLISIPQAGPLDSLNASVAGALVMYEVYRQRLGS